VVTQDARVWATLQGLISDYAIGPKAYDDVADKYVDPPQTPGEIALCHSQKMIKAGGFAYVALNSETRNDGLPYSRNINVFGLAFITAVSCTFMLLDYFILRFLIYMQRFRTQLAPRIDRWIQDGALQLQRRAHEAHGYGTWNNLNKEIPTMLVIEKLPELPLESLPHPTPGTGKGVPASQHGA